MLEVKDLEVQYGKAEALKGISISVYERDVVSIVGANGAGKTTLLRTISGLIKPNSGEIRFAGNRISGTSPHRIVKMGIAHIPAGRQIFAPMSVLDNLKASAKGKHRRRTAAQVMSDIQDARLRNGTARKRFVEAVKSHIEEGANGKEEEEAPSTDQEVTVTPETKDMFNE